MMKKGLKKGIKNMLFTLGAVFLLMSAGCGVNEGDAGSPDKTTTQAAGATVTETSEAETETSETEPQTEAQTEVTTEKSDIVEQTLAEMTLHEKVCQMMFVKPEGLTGVDVVTSAGDITKNALADYPVGGIMYSAQNLESVEQTEEMIANAQSYIGIDMFIAADEEGGTVNRLMTKLGTTYIDSMYTYRNDGTQTAYDNAYTIASDMATIGFNLDFAPVADVWSNPDNTVIGERAYSDDFSQAAELVGSAVRGFEDGGVLCTLKHFPGHGDTAQDSHYSSAYVTKTKEEIMSEEMLTFAAGIEAGADFVMVGHLIVPDIDELPATLSYKIATEMLRDEMGFEGIAITDALEMEAISDNYTSGEAVTMAVQAGMDMLLEPEDLAEAVTALEQAVQNGLISEERIDESVRKILEVKADKGMLK